MPYFLTLLSVLGAQLGYAFWKLVLGVGRGGGH